MNTPHIQDYTNTTVSTHLFDNYMNMLIIMYLKQ